jgi:FHS family Na+ dependent glucose MFS transporter 1
MRKTILYSLAFIALGLVTGSLGPTLPALATQTNAEVKQISDLFIARSLGTMIGSWMIGRFYDRMAGHPLLASSLLASALAMALIPTAAAMPALLVLIAFMGIASASINVGANALIVLIHGERVRPFISGLHFAFGLGGFLAPVVVARLVTHANSLRLTYWSLAVIIVPIALLTFLVPSPALHEHKRLNSKTPLPMAIILLFGLFFFLEVGAETTVMGWYFSYAAERGMELRTAAYMNSGFWAAFTLGRLATIWMIVRFNVVKTIVAHLSLTMLIGLSLLIFPSTSPTLWFGAIGLGAAFAPIFPCTFGLAQRVLNLSGKVMGFFLVGSSAGSMFWPWLTGQFFKARGPQVMVWVALVNLVGALVTLTILGAQPQRAKAHE